MPCSLEALTVINPLFRLLLSKGETITKVSQSPNPKTNRTTKRSETLRLSDCIYYHFPHRQCGELKWSSCCGGSILHRLIDQGSVIIQQVASALEEQIAQFHEKSTTAHRCAHSLPLPHPGHVEISTFSKSEQQVYDKGEHLFQVWWGIGVGRLLSTGAGRGKGAGNSYF